MAEYESVEHLCAACLLIAATKQALVAFVSDAVPVTVHVCVSPRRRSGSRSSLSSLKPECMGRVGDHLYLWSELMCTSTVLAPTFVYVYGQQHLSWFPASFGTILLAAACT